MRYVTRDASWKKYEKLKVPSDISLDRTVFKNLLFSKTAFLNLFNKWNNAKPNKRSYVHPQPAPLIRKNAFDGDPKLFGYTNVAREEWTVV